MDKLTKEQFAKLKEEMNKRGLDAGKLEDWVGSTEEEND